MGETIQHNLMDELLETIERKVNLPPRPGSSTCPSLEGSRKALGGFCPPLVSARDLSSPTQQSAILSFSSLIVPSVYSLPFSLSSFVLFFPTCPRSLFQIVTQSPVLDRLATFQRMSFPPLRARPSPRLSHSDFSKVSNENEITYDVS